MSDNELDNLFKESAEGFKTPHDPSAWKDMSNRLDQAGVGSSVFWNWKIISSIAVVGLMGISIVWYASKQKIDQPVSQEIATIQPIENKELTPGQFSVGKSTEASAMLSTQKKQETIPDREGGIQKTAQENLSGNTIAGSAENGKNLKTTQKNKKINSGQEKSENPVQNSVGQIAIAGTATVNKSELPISAKKREEDAARQISDRQIVSEKPVSKSSSETEELDHPPKTTIALTDSLIKPMEDLKTSVDSTHLVLVNEKTEEHDKKQRTTGLGIKLMVSPDYTSVNSSTPDGLGLSYGILFEFQFSDHWSIATGGIRTKKIYTAYDVEYNGYTADWVDGDCRMWDIPVNVYYNVTPNRSFSFYAGLGLSSYLMSEENYVFYVETPNGTYDYPKQVKSENNEWFKTLNVSLGMQLKLNNKFTLQLEPTLKAPLAGVGEGEVSLVSLGAFFNLRFDIPISKP